MPHGVRHGHIRPQLGLNHVKRLFSAGIPGAEAQGDQLGL